MSPNKDQIAICFWQCGIRSQSFSPLKQEFWLGVKAAIARAFLLPIGEMRTAISHIGGDELIIRRPHFGCFVWS
ncbi:MAG: hypothetical protein F6K19_24740 [Cyanothece sp. SIO1E1]|nr:hypothetical protein [Cyanothece sp. SIO1E1]